MHIERAPAIGVGTPCAATSHIRLPSDLNVPWLVHESGRSASPFSSRWKEAILPKEKTAPTPQRSTEVSFRFTAP